MLAEINYRLFWANLTTCDEAPKGFPLLALRRKTTAAGGPHSQSRGDVIAAYKLEDWILIPVYSLFCQRGQVCSVTRSAFLKVLVGTFVETHPSPYESLSFGTCSPRLKLPRPFHSLIQTPTKFNVEWFFIQKSCDLHLPSPSQLRYPLSYMTMLTFLLLCTPIRYLYVVIGALCGPRSHKAL